MRKVWRAVLDQIPVYDAGKPLEALRQELGRDDLVRLSANESPLGPSPRAVEAIRREAASAHLYPDGGATALRTALAAHVGVTPQQVLVGNGADEVLAILAWAAFEPGDEVVVPEPSFEPYTAVVTLMGATVVLSPLATYDIDLDDVRRRISPRTKAVMLCSPHNPATTIVRGGPLRAFLESLGAEAPLVVLDEAYRDFCDDPDCPDGVRLLERHPNLLVMRTFSKIAGLAGLRIGFAVGTAEAIERMNRVRAPYNVNRLGQVAAVAALDDPEHLARTRQLVLEERVFLTRELSRRGYAFPPSQANFLLVKVPDAPAARQRLLAAGLLVRDGAAVGFPGHLRISIGRHQDNERLLAALGTRG
ncbi:MAG: histidinol-phosphate transaminase [Candidatus Rokubacteria bacterium]|nr:histidinol-phosphate transaminase [Candidatus Rokubacteria bacterium]MBI3825099.1 histidinol-phosphate transaminase [Candidatus Rokubacteria bacterium]